MNKKGLDEMQLQRKYKIGNQGFVMLLYLLLLDTGLYGFGFRWISYPANVMIILTLCSGIYVVRLISGNAFVGPFAKNEKPVLKAVLTALCSVSVAAVIIVLLKNAGFSNAGQIDDMSAPILFITAATGLIIAAVTGVIKRKQNRDDGK
jgi:hypothetical protein